MERLSRTECGERAPGGKPRCSGQVPPVVNIPRVGKRGTGGACKEVSRDRRAGRDEQTTDTSGRSVTEKRRAYGGFARNLDGHIRSRFLSFEDAAHAVVRHWQQAYWHDAAGRKNSSRGRTRKRKSSMSLTRLMHT
eukprot:303451-Pyramimonas_sp.AAC.1